MKTPAQNLYDTLNGKKVLFLENDMCLTYGVDKIRDLLKEKNIEYTILYDLSNVPLSDIENNILEHDAIIFMTTWKTNIAHELSDYMFSLRDSKIVIEVYIHEPTWFHRPKNVAHDVYIYSNLDGTEEFYKLSDKNYWEYKNEFNK